MHCITLTHWHHVTFQPISRVLHHCTVQTPLNSFVCNFFLNSSWILFRVRVKLLCQRGRCSYSKFCLWRGHGAWFGVVNKAHGTTHAACCTVRSTAS